MEDRKRNNLIASTRCSQLLKSMDSSYNSELCSISPDVLNRYMPHFPINPSPLRRALELSSLLDGDDDDCGSKHGDYNEFIQKTDNRKKHNQRVRYNSDNERLALLNSTTCKNRTKIDFDKCNEDLVTHLDVPSIGAILKGLMFPTALGIIIASRLYDIHLLPKGSRKNLHDTLSLNYTNFRSINSTTYDTPKTDDLRMRLVKPPILIEDTIEYSPVYMKSHLLYEEQLGVRYDIDKEAYKLPSPNEKISEPKYRSLYHLIYFLQILLNGMFTILISSMIFTFMQTLTTEVKTGLVNTRSELEHKFVECRENYIKNQCGAGRRRAALFEEHCLLWKCCMNKNEDFFFIWRSTVTWTLIHKVLMLSIEPTSLYEASFITIGLFIWIFSSNCFFGFLKAISYYGIETPRLLNVSTHKND